MTARAINTIVALLITALFGTVSALCLSAVHRETHFTNNLVQLKRGVNNFGVWSPENKECVGYIATTVDPESQDFQLTAKGTIRAKLGEKSWDTSILAQLSFSVLGQLSIGRIKIENGGNSLVVMLTDVSPINITATMQFEEKSKVFRFSIPGPIELRELSHDNYGIVAPDLKLSSDQNSLILNQPVIKQLLPSVQQLSSDEQCSEQKLSAVDISQWEKISERFSGLIGGLGD